MKTVNEFPLGWDEQSVREVIDYYENQTDEEAAAEHETALSSPEEALMTVPHELVPRVHELIARYEPKQKRKAS